MLNTFIKDMDGKTTVIGCGTYFGWNYNIQGKKFDQAIKQKIWLCIVFSLNYFPFPKKQKQVQSPV